MTHLVYAILIALGLAGIVIGAVLTQLIVLFCGAALLIITLVLISRIYLQKLATMRKRYFDSLKEDGIPELSKKKLYLYSFLACSAYYAVWLIAGFLLPLGGTTAWLFVSIGLLVISMVAISSVAGCWKDLEQKRILFFGFNLLIYLLSIALAFLLQKLF